MNTPQPLARARVVLVRTSHPGNIGAAARAMKTMGLSRLALVAPEFFPDPVATARATGAADVLDAATVCASLDQALAGTVASVALTARRRELSAPPLWVREAAASVAVAAASGEIALVFGNETSGLSNDEVARCTLPAMIPTNPDFASLNLGAAVQVACYELRMALLEPGAPPAVADAGEPARHEEIEALVQQFERSALASGFLVPERPGRLVHRMRRLFARAGIEREEAAILHGLLKSLQPKVD